MPSLRNPKRRDGATRGKLAVVVAMLTAHQDGKGDDWEDLTFDEMRKLLPAPHRDIADGVLHQILIDEGYEVDI